MGVPDGPGHCGQRPDGIQTDVESDISLVTTTDHRVGQREALFLIPLAHEAKRVALAVSTYGHLQSIVARLVGERRVLRPLAEWRRTRTPSSGLPAVLSTIPYT